MLVLKEAANHLIPYVTKCLKVAPICNFRVGVFLKNLNQINDSHPIIKLLSITRVKENSR